MAVGRKNSHSVHSKFDLLAQALLMSEFVRFIEPPAKKLANRDFTVRSPWVSQPQPAIAFAMARYWPDVRIEIGTKRQGVDDDSLFEWRIFRANGAPSDHPVHVVFRAPDKATVETSMLDADSHFQKFATWKRADMTQFAARKKMFEEFRAYVAASKALAARAAEKEASAQRKATQVWPPVIGSEHEKALTTSEKGWDFNVQFERPNTASVVRRSSSAKAVMAKLRDPDFELVRYDEFAGLSSKFNDGSANIYLYFAPPGAKHATICYAYQSRPYADLHQAREEKVLGQTRDPKTPKKNIKTRADTL